MIIVFSFSGFILRCILEFIKRGKGKERKGKNHKSVLEFFFSVERKGMERRRKENLVVFVSKIFLPKMR